MLIQELFFDQCRKKNFSIIDNRKKWLYEEIKERVHMVKNNLLQTGLKPLEKVALVSENSGLFVIALFGILAAGGTIVFIEPQLPKQRITQIIQEMDIRFICLSGGRPETFSDELKREGRHVFSESSGEWQGELKSEKQVLVRDEEPAFILFSSGTSGKPKGIVLSHRAIINNVLACQHYIEGSSDDCFLILRSMPYLSTITYEILLAAMLGAKLVAKNPVVSPNTLIKRIRDLQATVICVNPTMLSLLLLAVDEGETIDRLRFLHVSGSLVEKDLLRQAQEVFVHAHIINAYGLTEAGPRVTAQRIGYNRKHDSVGSPVPGVKIRLKKETGEECAVHEPGRIFVSSPSLMIEYYDNPIETKKKLQDGWLDTGDLGYLDEDGDLFILGRADDMILKGAHNITPQHIEGVIETHPLVDECIVFGIKEKNNDHRIVCAIMGEKAQGLKKKDILHHCKSHLAAYECPQEVMVWEQMPKNIRGKISRKGAVERYFEERGQKNDKKR